MKPLSEFLEDMRADGENLSGDVFLVNQANCDLLQAWLREADKALDENERAPSTVLLGWVRHKLLGTTRTEGKK